MFYSVRLFCHSFALFLSWFFCSCHNVSCVVFPRLNACQFRPFCRLKEVRLLLYKVRTNVFFSFDDYHFLTVLLCTYRFTKQKSEKLFVWCMLNICAKIIGKVTGKFAKNSHWIHLLHIKIECVWFHKGRWNVELQFIVLMQITQIELCFQSISLPPPDQKLSIAILKQLCILSPMTWSILFSFLFSCLHAMKCHFLSPICLCIRVCRNFPVSKFIRATTYFLCVQYIYIFLFFYFFFFFHTYIVKQSKRK